MRARRRKLREEKEKEKRVESIEFESGDEKDKENRKVSIGPSSSTVVVNEDDLSEHSSLFADELCEPPDGVCGETNEETIEIGSTNSTSLANPHIVQYKTRQKTIDGTASTPLPGNLISSKETHPVTNETNSIESKEEKKETKISKKDVELGFQMRLYMYVCYLKH
jgi:hypothetical protein